MRKRHLLGEGIGGNEYARTVARPPNILLLITDQQRYPRHWPQDRGWLQELTPNDAELERTGLAFRNAFCNTAMCSPSRATLLTSQYPAQHGVTLTLTTGDLRPARRRRHRWSKRPFGSPTP
jgi:arylsulfatase A-like enzyme